VSDPVSRLNAALEGRYRVEREIGKGGMATVYLADDLRHGRSVALKVLKPDLFAAVGGNRRRTPSSTRLSSSASASSLWSRASFRLAAPSASIPPRHCASSKLTRANIVSAGRDHLAHS